MRIYKNKAFSKWAGKEGVSDSALEAAVEEMANGLIDADLGGHVYKKRVAVGGKGKSGGVRTLLAYKVDDKAFFVYGFAKNARSNIKDDELKALKLYAKNLFGYSDRELAKAVKAGILIEVKGNG
ncbi:type II toxin-antitoxin system RelE/ParE family toxin [Microbulbifer sp. VAAC004]|uniref:type II toxin-antitoxin system RelE/ParE family toxin n=1 Tax=unclassified Microbulbifer TaxID=2619833 RepID=UPI0040397406